MQEIHIDKEFQDLLPPLDKDTYKALEENIIANGCMYPLVIWRASHNEAKGILIDGHNRYAICTKHNIPYKVVEKEFSSREDVLVWIISNQVARRNLTLVQLTYFRGLHYNTMKKKIGNPEGKNQYTEVEYKNYTLPKVSISADELSKQYKVSRPTIFSDAKATNAIEAIGKQSNIAKSRILSGEVSINKQELKRLATATENEIKELASAIENNTYEKVKPNTGNETNIKVVKMPALGKISGDIEAYVTDGAVGEKYRTFLDTSRTGNVKEVKKTLRAYINALENVYKQLG